MCLPGAVGLVLGVILRQGKDANLPLWSPYRAINLPIWIGLQFLLTDLGYLTWGAIRLRSLR